DAIEGMLDKMVAAPAPAPAFVAMHSFTPLFDGFERPWHMGVLWDRDDRLAAPLLAALAADPLIHVGDNEPYSGRAVTPYSTPRHAERRGLACHGGNPPGPHRHPSRRRGLGATHGGGPARKPVMPA
ncbi:MAG: N-formylglutamate amidohydrolase, partial [Proteobacteria bacterium]|nr:N-formylglutamate amidohydrolase [Pseudomonadota bacterium]